jgi:hypothetical protein
VNEPNASWRSKDRLALLVVCLAALTSTPWLTWDFVDPLPGAGDGAIYVLTAQSLLEGDGYRYLGEPFVIRPPGFSLLLAPILAAFGSNLFALNLYVQLLGVLGISLVFGFYRARVGWAVAAALAATVWLNPTFRNLANRILSDVPGLAPLFACLLLSRWARREVGIGRSAVLGLAIGLSSYVRSSIILLAPAIAIARLLREPGSRAGGLRRPLALILPILLVPLLVQLPWSLRNAAAVRVVPAEHTLLYSIPVAMFHRDKGDPASPRITPAGMLERIQVRVPQLLRALNGRLRPNETGPLYPLPALGGLLCCGIVLVRRREPAELFAAGLLVVLVTYFGFAMRLVLPLYVLVLACVALVLRDALAPRLGARAAQGIVAGLLLLLAFGDYRHHEGWNAARVRAAKVEAVTDYLASHVPEDVPIAADFGAHYAVSLGRPVYSLRWSMRRGGTEAARRFLDRYDVGVVVVDEEQHGGKHLVQILTRENGCEARPAPGICIGRTGR